jgi:hypothetical protein
MLMDDLKRLAKEILVKDGNHQPMFFLCSDEQIIGTPLRTAMFDEVYKDNLNAEDSKTRSVYCMGALAKELGANRLIMIWDAAMRMAAPGTSLGDIDVTEMPLQFPKSMRTECLIFNDISFVTGKDVTSVIPYKGGAGEPVKFLKNNLPEGASLESRFTDIALKGYNKIS